VRKDGIEVFCDRQRLHSGLGHRTLAQALLGHLSAATAA
jgi:hypothetical protein